MDEPSKLEWRGQLAFEQHVAGRRLTVVAQPFHKRSAGPRWAGIAVEAPAEAETLSEVLANHAHADIGDFETIFECIAACEKYIQAWLDGKVREAACACADIAVRAADETSPTA
jgi:phage-related baseplate assembly protein